MLCVQRFLMLLASTCFIALAVLPEFTRAQESSAGSSSSHAIVLHGGAGTLLPENFTPELEKQYREKLAQAVRAGDEVLRNGGSSIEAVKVTVVLLEDSPLFNAGKGSVFTHDGENELDASIMVGSDLSAGAVAGVKRVKNPILLADKVRTESDHVMMSGEGAEAFAIEQKQTLVEPKYFYTERRWKALQKAKKASVSKRQAFKDWKYGTVGVVALDKNGVIAAGTSTGGMTNKRYGRIGDSPIIGAGTYANQTCGISATGHGEFFIRAGVAKDICARMEYKSISGQRAADEVIQTKLVQMGGTGGIVGLDQTGNIIVSFNTPGMYRASINVQGEMKVDIFK